MWTLAQLFNNDHASTESVLFASAAHFVLLPMRQETFI